MTLEGWCRRRGARYLYLLAGIRLQALTGQADTAMIDEVNTALRP